MLTGPIVWGPTSSGDCTFVACNLYTPFRLKTSVCDVPVCQCTSPSASRGPAVWTTSKSIGQLIRIDSRVPAATEIVRAAPSGRPSFVAQT